MYSSASNRRRRTPEPRARAPIPCTSWPRPGGPQSSSVSVPPRLHTSPSPSSFSSPSLRLRHPGSSWASHLSTSGVQITIYDYRVIGPFGCSSNSDPLHRVSSMPCNLRGSTIESPFFYYHLLYSKYSLFDP